MYPIRKATKNSHVKWNVKIVESRKLSQFSPRIAANANCSVVSESQYRIMHTDKSRQNPWTLTSNTVVFEIQTFCLQRRCISLTEKWLTSSVIPTLSKWCLGKCQIVKTVQKYTVCVCVCVSLFTVIMSNFYTCNRSFPHYYRLNLPPKWHQLPAFKMADGSSKRSTWSRDVARQFF